MKTFKPIFILLFLAVPPALYAGEGTVDRRLGKPIRLAGYDGRADDREAYNPRFVELELNVRRFGSAGPVRINPWEADFKILIDNVTFAMGMWQNIPTARVHFRIGLEISFQHKQKDRHNMISLTDVIGAYGATWRQYDLKAIPYEISEFDIAIREDRSRDLIGGKSTMTHEIGHGLGLEHSFLSGNCVQNVTGSSSSPASIMAYSKARDSAIERNALVPDDVASVSRLYPNHFNRLSRTTGTVMGRVVNGPVTREIFGINLLLIKRSSGEAILSGLSGYATSTLRSRNGTFQLNGVPPGYYDLLAVSVDDPLVKLGDFRAPRISDGYYFEHCFHHAWVRKIKVSAGEIVDLGYVLEGRDRLFALPDRFDATLRFWNHKIGEYRMSLYRKDGRRGYRLEKVTAPFQLGRGIASRYLQAIRPGRYKILLERKGKNSWKRTRTFYRNFKRGMVKYRWWRKHLRTKYGKVEAWTYRLTLGAQPSMEVHGSRYTTIGHRSFRRTQLRATWQPSQQYRFPTRYWWGHWFNWKRI